MDIRDGHIDENTVRFLSEGLKKDVKSQNCLTTCPTCGLAVLEYDSLLNLRCPVCGDTASGSFT